LYVDVSLLPESDFLYDWQRGVNRTLRPTDRIVVFKMNAYGYRPYVTSFLTRGWVCRLQLLLGLASAIILRSESSGTHDRILLSQIRDFPNLEGQVPVFIPPRNRVAWLYPLALGSLFVASYDSQGYGGGIRPPSLHTARNTLKTPIPVVLLLLVDVTTVADRTEKCVPLLRVQLLLLCCLLCRNLA
jgi:hypothetical protein